VNPRAMAEDGEVTLAELALLGISEDKALQLLKNKRVVKAHRFFLDEVRCAALLLE
jgi:hypothetical protein